MACHGEIEGCHQTSLQTQLRRLHVLQQHLSVLQDEIYVVTQAPCRASVSHPEAKVAKAGEAVALIPDSAVITVRTTAYITSICMCPSTVSLRTVIVPRGHLGMLHGVVSKDACINVLAWRDYVLVQPLMHTA